MTDAATDELEAPGTIPGLEARDPRGPMRDDLAAQTTLSGAGEGEDAGPTSEPEPVPDPHLPWAPALYSMFRQLNAYGEPRGSVWCGAEGEHRALADSFGPLLDRYLPAGQLTLWGVAGFAAVSYVGPRLTELAARKRKPRGARADDPEKRPRADSPAPGIHVEPVAVDLRGARDELVRDELELDQAADFDELTGQPFAA